MTKIGIIACQKFWKKGCPGLSSHVLCFEALRHKSGLYQNFEEVMLVNMVSCSGCPGTSLPGIAEQMITQDAADYIVFPSCVLDKGHCPGLEKATRAIENKYPGKVLLGNYHDDPALTPYLKRRPRNFSRNFVQLHS